METVGTDGLELLRPTARARSTRCQLPVFLVPQDDRAEGTRWQAREAICCWNEGAKSKLEPCIFIMFLFVIIFYWRMIDLQCCVSFCCLHLHSLNGSLQVSCKEERDRTPGVQLKIGDRWKRSLCQSSMRQEWETLHQAYLLFLSQKF